MRILILGGYGTFGGRLVDLLLDEARLTIIVAGRSTDKAKAFIDERPASASTLEILEVDRNDPEAAFAQCRPDVVVDATGPFQSYGDDPYRVVRAAIDVGAHWLDLADAAAFATGIVALDDAARSKGVFVLSGVSSFPVLSSAVASALAEDMTRVDSISGGIAPSPYAGVGFNVIDAIASYAGKRIPILVDGRPSFGHGMIDSMWRTVSVPGTIPLPRTRFALVEVPDLQVLAEQHPGVRSVWIGAGPTPSLLHRLLQACAHLVKWRLLPSLRPMAPLMDRVVNTVRWGEHRGGMWIALGGNDASGKVERSWHLLAEGDMGPFIPSMACEIIVRELLEGRSPPAGARPGSGALLLSDYDAVFERRGILTGVRIARPGVAELPYRRVMGSAFERLAEPLRSVHDFEQRSVHRGRADVMGAQGILGGLIARVMGFPKAGKDVEIEVAMERRGDVEEWTRTYDGVPFRSELAAGKDGTRMEGLLTERMGPLLFGMAVVEQQGALSLIMRGWSAFGIPMPRWSLPRVVAGEHGRNGRFDFSVEIGLPLLGRIVRYEGWIAAEALEEEHALEAAE